MKKANNRVSYSLRGQAIAPRMVPLSTASFEDQGCTFVCWLSGAGWFINCHGTVLMVDPLIAYKPLGPGIHTVSELDFPLFQELPVDAEDVTRLDAVLYTHADGDHQGQMTVKILNRNTSCSFWGTDPVQARLAEMGVSADRCCPVKVGQGFSIGPMNIMPTVANHSWQNMNREFYGQPYKLEDCCGFYICTPDGNIWITGDTMLCPEHLQMQNVDLMALDISEGKNFWHMGHEDTVRLANTLSQTHLIPHHYGSYDEPYHPYFCTDPLDFVDEISNADERFHILGPGEPYILRQSE